LTDICLNEHCPKIFKIGQIYELELEIRIHRNYTPMGLEPFDDGRKYPTSKLDGVTLVRSGQQIIK